MTAINPVLDGLRQHAQPDTAQAGDSTQLLSQALLALVEASIQTVSLLASKRSRTRLEYLRHIGICQSALTAWRAQRIQGPRSQALSCLEQPGASLEAWLTPQEASPGPRAEDPLMSARTHGRLNFNFENVGDSVAYLTECALATVEGLCEQSNPAARELIRHCSIAQVGVDALYLTGLHSISTAPRARELISQGLSASEWADAMRMNRGMRAGGL